MQQSKELSTSFIEHNRDPILLLDLKGTIILANRAFSHMLGWQKEHLEGLNIFSCPSIPAHLIEQMKDYHYRIVTTLHPSQAAAESSMSKLETIRISNDGKAYHMMLSITPIFDYDARLSNWAVHLRDITAQKEIEKKLLRAEILVSAGKMAAGITHEIRNPLTSLKGLLQLMHSEGEYNHDYIVTMAKEVHQIETFVDEISLLAMSKAPPYKMTDLSQLLHSVISLLDTQAIMSKVTVECKHDPLPPVLCNEESVKKAFFNILQNGIEAMPSGGRLSVNTKLCSGTIHIEVIDQGVGISEERLPKLGEPFYSNKEKGIGLGLMLTYKIIEQHNWHIHVQSQINRGTKTTISIPI